MKTKKFPSSAEDFSARIEGWGIEMGRESDRGLILISAALLEENLEMLLRSFMREGPTVEKDIIGPLFCSDGPLSSFASKARLCYALHVIDAQTYSDLNIIRGIRNSFAHGYAKATLEEQSVKDRIAQLKYSELFARILPKDCELYFKYDSDGGNRQRVSDSRRRFTMAFVMLSATLEGAICEFRASQSSLHRANAKSS